MNILRLRASVISLAFALLLHCLALQCIAQDKGMWRAASNTANSITGDIAISPIKLTINIVSYPLAQVRTLKPEEVSAVFDADISAGGTGTLYSLRIPAAQRFLHKNTLCGSDETQWMATFVSGRTLQLAFFSGSVPPVFTLDAISKSGAVCGTFTYAR